MSDPLADIMDAFRSSARSVLNRWSGQVVLGEPSEELQLYLTGEVCNVCNHPIHQLECSTDWVCTGHCRCLMIGCVPKLTWFAIQETVRKDV